MYTKYYLNLVTWFRVLVKQCYIKIVILIQESNYKH